MLLFHWLQCPVLIHLNKSLCVFWFRTFFFSEVGYGYLCLVIAKNERQLFVAGWVSLVLAVEGCPGTFWFNRHEVRSTTVVWQQVSLSAKTFSVALSSIIVGSKSRKGRKEKKSLDCQHELVTLFDGHHKASWHLSHESSKQALFPDYIKLFGWYWWNL